MNQPARRQRQPLRSVILRSHGSEGSEDDCNHPSKDLPATRGRQPNTNNTPTRSTHRMSLDTVLRDYFATHPELAATDDDGDIVLTEQGAQMLGHAFAALLGYNGDEVLRVTVAALHDANFHNTAERVEKLRKHTTLREALFPPTPPTPAEGAALLADALHLAGAERYPSLSPACYLVEGDLSSLDGVDALRDYPLGSEKRDVLVTLVHDLVNGDLSAAEVHAEIDSLGE